MSSEDTSLLKAPLSDKSAVIFLYPFILQGITIEEAQDAIEAAMIRAPRTGEYRPLWKPAGAEDYKGTGAAEAISEILQQGYWHMWKLSGDAVGLLKAPLYKWQMMRLSRNWRMHLLLSGKGIGFLGLRLSLEEMNLEQGMELLANLRRMSTIMTLQRRKEGGAEEPFPLREWELPFPDKARKGNEESATTAEMKMEEWVHTFLSHSLGGQDRYAALHDKRYLIPYAWLIIDTRRASPDPDWSSELESVLYRLRHFFRPRGDDEAEGAPMQYEGRNQLAYARRSWFLSSLEGSIFFSADSSRFIQEQLPDRLEKVYLFAYQFVLLQRFYLLHFSQQYMLDWMAQREKPLQERASKRFSFGQRLLEWIDLAPGHRLQVFQKRMEDFVEFMTMYYPPQVFLGERHHKAYLFWQETLEVPRLYERVQYQLRLLYEYTENEESRRIENRLNQFGVLIGVPSIIFSMLSINIIGFTANEGLQPLAAVAWIGGALGLAVLLSILLLRKKLSSWFGSRKRHSKTPPHMRWISS